MEISKFERLRHIKELTQVQLCKMAGIKVNTYQKLINGIGDPQVSTVEGVAKALGVEVGIFFRSELNNYNIIEEPRSEYGNKTCLDCLKKDEALLVINTKLIEKVAENKLLVRSNNNLNRTLEKCFANEKPSKQSKAS